MQAVLEKPITGFKIIPFQALHSKVMVNLNDLLTQRHGTSGDSGWEVHKARVQILATILKNDEQKYTNILALLPPKALNDPNIHYTSDYILTAVCWEFTAYVEKKSSYMFPATNSVNYRNISEWLGYYDSQKKLVIPENKPTWQQQKQMYTDLLYIFNHLVYLGGASSNGFLPQELLYFPVKDTTPFLHRLSEGITTTEKICAAEALMEHQRKEERSKQQMASQQPKVSPTAGGFWQPTPYNNLSSVNPDSLQLPPTGEPASTLEGLGTQFVHK